LSHTEVAVSRSLSGYWIAAGTLVASFAIFGVLEGFGAGNRAASFFLSTFHYVIIAAILYAWTSSDAARHGRELSGAMVVCLVVFGFLAMPFYLATYRPHFFWPRWLLKGLMVLGASIWVFIVAFERAAQ
jgi:hypothetical protein